MRLQEMVDDLRVLSEAVSSGKVTAEKDFRTGYWKVTVGGEMFVTTGDRMFKGKAEAIKVAKQRAAKGSWYILPWNGSGRYRKEDAVAGPIKNYEKCEAELDNGGHDLSRVVIRWFKD